MFVPIILFKEENNPNTWVLLFHYIFLLILTVASVLNVFQCSSSYVSYKCMYPYGIMCII